MEIFECFICPFLSLALLEAIMKNGSTAGSGTHCRKPANKNDKSKINNMKDSSASAAGEVGKTYTKEQIEGVQRY